MTFHDGFLSEMIGRTAVVTADGRQQTVGRISDFVVERPDDTFPKIDALVIKSKRGKHLAPIGSIVDFDRRRASSSCATCRRARRRPTTRRSTWSRTSSTSRSSTSTAARSCASTTSRSRAPAARCASSRPTSASAASCAGSAAGNLSRALIERIPRTLIAWDNVAPLHDLNPTEIRLSVSDNRLARLHPCDLAEIIGDLSARDAARVVGSLDDETAADALEHLDAETQRSIIDDLGAERAADIIEEMDSDDAADLLGELPEEQQEQLLREMDAETADDLRELVAYDEETAGGLMTTDYMWIYPHRTVAATIAKIREIAPETEFIYYLYVTDQSEKLLGVLSLRTLLLSAPDDIIHTVMDTDVVSVHPDVKSTEVASTIARYDLLACPVLDDDGKMLGIVTVDDAIDAIIPERLKKQLPRFTKRQRRERLERV